MGGGIYIISLTEREGLIHWPVKNRAISDCIIQDDYPTHGRGHSQD